MKSKRYFLFPPFWVDVDGESLWRENKVTQLKPTAVGVLCCLLNCGGKWVSQEDLFQSVWGFYSKRGGARVRKQIQAVRKELGYGHIRSVRGQGYKFIGTVTDSALVGRENELTLLEKSLAKAQEGERQVVFVTGERGIGKTTLVEVFRERLPITEGPWIARGKCSLASPAYTPVLEGLRRLYRERKDDQLVKLLKEHAPSWLAQLTAIPSNAELERPRQEIMVPSHDRMLHEMADMLEALPEKASLVLWLEDLHWSDDFTLDLIFFLARRQERARLLVVGEYRPQEAASSEHLLKKVTQELKEHGQCEELRLKELTEDDIADYLAARFPREQVPMGLAKIIYRYTGGHPMFLELTVDELERREWIADPSVQRKLRAKLEELAATVPSGVREVIEGQFDRLSGEEKRLVEVASVAGEQFSASAVAAALEKKASDVEDICEGLACREQFLRRKEDEEWPDGTLATCYKFRHSWYWEVVYKRVTTAKRLELHRRIGEGLEKAFGKQARKKGGELAKHFERGRDYERAVQYLMQEAGTDLQRWGYSAKRVERLYLRASKLCRKVENPHRLFEVNKLGWTVYHTKAKLNEAFDLANRLVSLANQLKDEDPSTLVIAHEALGETFFRRGEFTDALGEFRYGVDFFDYLRPSSAAWVKPGVACQSYTGWVLWFLGYPEQALGKITDALSRARELSERDPYTLVSTLDFAARLRQFRREEQAVRELAEEAIKLSKDRFGLRMAQATILHGWALAQQGKVKEGIEETCEGLAECRGTGTEILRPYYLALLVEVYRKAGQAKKGLSTLVKALDAVKRSGERNYEAELYRLKGELLLKQKVKAKRQKTESEAEACFRKAIDIARSQGAKSLELRAVMSLGRLWQRQGKNEEAREMLAAIYRQFTEGFDTTDLKKAKALLETL